ncbi:zinc ribbon domain-containing protein [Crassaminicella indica]|uniref:Transposase n=1 Tax=Crassaminicella indica TaxID=2855394 RepID=A0ABX8RBM6_9CLOT|nr:zinc ribbon domain-containing protein [Crassaminicella indica]QXM06458.1 transposase [Crassaminicella indica]
MTDTYKFVTILEYKAKWYGRKLHKIDRWYPSSKTCSECGDVMEGRKSSWIHQETPTSV